MSHKYVKIKDAVKLSRKRIIMTLLAATTLALLFFMTGWEGSVLSIHSFECSRFFNKIMLVVVTCDMISENYILFFLYHIILQWKCCDIHVKEFDEFMSIPPCAKGWHNADPESWSLETQKDELFSYSCRSSKWNGKGVCWFIVVD